MSERMHNSEPRELDRLREENDKLRRSLAETQEERDRYLQAFYEESRKNLNFEDVDIPDLQAQSAGPVELLD